jgi:hypothetical protein
MLEKKMLGAILNDVAPMRDIVPKICDTNVPGNGP